MRRAHRRGKISPESDVMGAAFNNSGVVVKRPRLLATSASVALYLWLVPPSVFGQKAGTGRILGHLDGISIDARGAHIKGWACQQGRPESLTVHIYANEGGNDRAQGNLRAGRKSRSRRRTRGR